LILGEEKGRRLIRVVAKDAVPFHGGTSGSNPSSSSDESATNCAFSAEWYPAKVSLGSLGGGAEERKLTALLDGELPPMPDPWIEKLAIQELCSRYCHTIDA